MAKRTYLTSDLQHFGFILKCGNFKKCSAKTKTGGDVYVNPKAEFLIVVRRRSDRYGNPLVSYYYSNAINHRLVAKNAYGYSIIVLDHAYTIHRLVAEAHLGPRPKGYEVNHIDENKQNNVLENLEYVTHSENMKKYWKNHKGEVKHTYHGRYSRKTGNYTAPDGTKTKMSFDEYIEKIRTERGQEAANNIIRNEVTKWLQK